MTNVSRALKEDLKAKFPCLKQGQHTHTDLSGGTYDCRNKRGLFYMALDEGIEKGAEAFINEVAPTSIRSYFIDLDFEVGPDSTYLDPKTFETVFKKSILPTTKHFFPDGNKWAGVRFAICVPTQVRDGKKKGKKKFGCHIRALQLTDQSGIKAGGPFLDVENMLYLRRFLLFALNRDFPTLEFDWGDALDESPMKNGGMRMLGMKKMFVKCPCGGSDEECDKCSFGMGIYRDNSKYEVYCVLDGLGQRDDERRDALNQNRVLCWAQTSISTDYETQAQADLVTGMVFQIPKECCSELGEEELACLRTANSTSDFGIKMEVEVKQKKRKRTRMGLHETNTLKKGGTTLEWSEATKSKFLTFLHVHFSNYFLDPKTMKKVPKPNPGLLQISKQIREDDGTIYVQLTGINNGRCLNRKGPGAHKDRTYLEIKKNGEVFQRCYSQNKGSALCHNGAAGCRRFKSPGVMLPTLLKMEMMGEKPIKRKRTAKPVGRMNERQRFLRSCSWL